MELPVIRCKACGKFYKVLDADGTDTCPRCIIQKGRGTYRWVQGIGWVEK